MKVLLLLNGTLVARFEHGIHAMWSARALSEENQKIWTVVDERGDVSVTIMEYRNGKAY
jgi:hypothetical protein